MAQYKLPPKIKIPFQTFSPETKEEILQRDGHKCVCKCGKCNGVVHSIHHLISNNKTNRKIYGNLLQRKENGISMSLHCHSRCTALFKQMAREVKDVFDTMIAENSNIIYASNEEIEINLNKYKKVV